MKRVVYDKQFKLGSVKMALSDEITVSQAAKEIVNKILLEEKVFWS